MQKHIEHTGLTRHLASATTERCFLERNLAFELGGTDEAAAAPDWIQIFPAGPKLATVDGRSFAMSDPQAFVDAQRTAAGQPILVDFDHLSAFAPDEGGDQTAAGWIEELEVRNGQVWARVAWTVRAAEQIADKQWRFVSPEFRANTKTGEVAILDAVALVNRPAFEMAALARAQNQSGVTDMKAIAIALGLAEDATEEQILTAIQKQSSDLETARASATPSLSEFVPRADYDSVLARAQTAETELESAATEAREAEVETFLAAAVKDRRITPATKSHYVALALASDEGFEQVKELCSKMPQIADPSVLNDAELAPKGGLTEEQRELCGQLGLTEEAFAAQLAREQG